METVGKQGSVNVATVVSRTLSVIDKHFEREQVLNELEASLLTITPKENGRDFEFIFYGKKLDLVPYGWYQKGDVNEFIKDVKSSSFWTELAAK